MKQKDEKNQSQSDRALKIIPVTLLVFALCGLSFYLGGIFCSEKSLLEGKIVQELSKAVSSPEYSAENALQIKPVTFSECSIDYQDYTPCTDPRRWKKYGYRRLTFLERHCPPLYERKECLVPPPDLIPEMRDGTVRTAIDTGCGVASWGGDLLDRGILTLSLAPRDNHEAQVQFALERGIPAILGVISTQRLPFPSSSFDMAHCSRCLIPWTEFGGIYLLEVHRILRPGGFWVLSGPPINYEHRYQGWNTTIEEQRAALEKLQDLLTSMCFTVYATHDDIAVWQKSSDIGCYEKLTGPDVYPATCDDSIEPDAAWYTPLRPCVISPRQKLKRSSVGSLPKWPQRLNIAPERISDVPGGSGNALKRDDSKWKMRAQHYKKILPAIGTDKIRNVMDMNTVYGGLAAALIDNPLWVMNVVSSYSANTLPVVFDRGLVGTYHDWCEAFSTYPRTYDLLHLDGLFAAESHRCHMKYVLLEMDRILRPEGHALIQESSYFMDAIETIAKGMRWNCHKEDTENSGEKEKILVCQKTLWYASSTNSTR
ncbi:hypothetical protein GOBAR_AA38628 [Gossypium barbadense]|uniref:Methyltransferase n=1 Tax=Gossypium barbadense TaxID=3634 RepID=A0A2P5VTB6_GOSBA|nr:hypothetical protein GOBAR_AA38628 [Gossypium barbadense]